MAEELQSLLDKINEEGIKKAEAEKTRIIEAAQNEAKAIRAKAAADAEAELKAAQEKAEALEKRAESALRQAARDIILQLQNELEVRLKRAVATAADQALTPEFMASLIRELGAKFAADPNAKISVLTTLKDAAGLNAALIGALKASFRTAPAVFGDAGIKGGMEVSFRDGELYFDFTTQAVTDLVSAYIGPRLAALLAGEETR